MKKKIITILSLALFIFGCSSKDGEKKTDAPKEKVVVVSQGSKPKSLDPNMYNEIPALAVTEQIFNTLLRIDDNGNVVPELAESYEYASPTELIIKIKKNVKFHNGDTMTVNDVVFSLNRMLEKPASRIMIEIIDKIDILDDSTIKLTLKNSSAPLLFSLAHPLTAILNEKDTKAKNDMIATEPMGTGPYKFVSWGDGEKIEFVAFDDYFEGRPKIDKLIIRAITENSSRLAALETGEIDIAYDIEGMDKERIREDKNLVFLEEPSLSIDYIGFNTKKAPFNDVRVRQAIASVINVDDIISTVYKGSATKANSLIGPKVFGHSDEAKAWTVDIDKAKALLAEAGYPNGFKSKIWINENPDRRDIAIIVQDQLRAIGVDIAVETLEWGAFLDGTSRGDHEMFILGWVSVTGDADYGLYPLLHTSCFGGAGNRAFYDNPKVDELLTKARNSNDQDERKALYNQVQIIVQEEVPLYITAYKAQNAGLQKYVDNFKLKAAGHHRLYGTKFKQN